MKVYCCKVTLTSLQAVNVVRLASKFDTANTHGTLLHDICAKIFTVYSKQKQRCWKLSEFRLSALVGNDSGYSPSVEAESSGHVVVGGTVSSARRLTGWLTDWGVLVVERKIRQKRLHWKRSKPRHRFSQRGGWWDTTETQGTNGKWKILRKRLPETCKTVLCCFFFFGQVS